MSYKIIIPSFKRHDLVQKYTLATLARTDASAEIYIFTADQEETDLYTEALKNHKVTIVTGVRGIPNQRNFIQRYFPEGERLVFIDDDIEQLQGLTADGKRVKVEKLDAFINTAFDWCDKLKLKMWGINSTASPFEMKQTASIGLIYIVGNFYGLINTHEVFVDEGEQIEKRKTFEAGKESHERALKMYFQYGGVIKFRAFGVVSKYWGVKGGHQISRNNSGEKEATEFLHKQYPHITKIRLYKGIYDLQIKPKTKVVPTAFYQ